MPDAAMDPVLEACSALAALAESIESERHELVAEQVEVLATRLRSMSAAQQGNDRIVLDDAGRAAIENAMQVGDCAFLRSIRACVRAVLASPLTGSVDLVYP